MGRYLFRTKNTYILLMASWMQRNGLMCNSSTTITSCCSIIIHGLMLQRSYMIPGSWKHSCCHPMANILTRYVTYWAYLGCCELAYSTACSSSCQCWETSFSYWELLREDWAKDLTNILSATINNLINSLRRRSLEALCEGNGGPSRYWLFFWPLIQ